MSLGVWQVVLILVIVLILFGAGKLPKVMGEMGKGMRSLKDGMKGEGESAPKAPKRVAKASSATAKKAAPKKAKAVSKKKPAAKKAKAKSAKKPAARKKAA